MAVALLTAFRRDFRSFVSKDGETVEYYEVHAIDGDNNYVVVRSAKIDGLEDLEVGKQVEFNGIMRSPIEVQVQLMKPATAESSSSVSNW